MKQRALALRTESLSHRKMRLKKLRRWIHTNRPAIHQAVYNDFRKTASEVDGVEIFHVLNEIKHALQHLDQWAAPKKNRCPCYHAGNSIISSMRTAWCLPGHLTMELPV